MARKPNSWRWLALVWVMALAGSVSGAEAPAKVDPAHVLDRLVRGHPRLMLTAARAAEVKELIQHDGAARRAVEEVLANADRQRGQAPIKPTAAGSTDLGTSSDCADRVYVCGLAWWLTGKEEYAAAVRANLLAAASFKDWSTTDFLSTGIMTQAVAIGYDWMFAQLSDGERATIRSALIDKGLKPGLEAYGEAGGRQAWWVETYVNWNPVCNSGLVIGALAIADERPEIARPILVHAIASLPYAIASYEPEGAWPEGPGYWDFATNYTVYALAALESALHSDFGLDQHEGLRRTGRFPLLTCGPTGLLANYADTAERTRIDTLPMLMWFARHYQRPEYARAELDLLTRKRASPFDVIWWPAAPPPAEAHPPLDACFHGQVDVACMRSAWDANALYAWIKGGFNQVNHGHLDLGEFEFDALGERWSRDLGSEDYGLPGYFDAKQGGKRWTYFRLGSSSHSVPLVDGLNQDANATAKLIAFSDHPLNPYAIVDYGDAYRPASSSAARGLMLVGRRALLVQDEFTLIKSSRFTWGMTTDATIEIDGAHAILTLNGKRVLASILSPAKAKFTSASAEHQPPEKANRGVQRLLVDLAAAQGALRVTVLLAPQWTDGAAPAPAVRPLAEWAVGKTSGKSAIKR